MLGSKVGLLTILLHQPPREAAAQVGDSSSCSVEDRESRWAGRSQALQQFEEELKMSVILCTGMFCGVLFLVKIVLSNVRTSSS